MSTMSITHRPAPRIAAVAVLVAGIAVGSLSLAHHDAGESRVPTHPSAPLSQPLPHHAWQPTTVGGKVMIGE